MSQFKIPNQHYIYHVDPRGPGIASSSEPAPEELVRTFVRRWVNFCHFWMEIPRMDY